MTSRAVPSRASLRRKLGLGWRGVQTHAGRLWSKLRAERGLGGRRIWPWVVALVVLLAAYPVLVTAALWTGVVERALASEDLKVEIDNPAWTIWPGRIHLEGVRVYMNGETQFTLSA